MAMIHVLDKNTIDKIAAGEVIERPASVVKELLENAIDAKSTAVTVEIKDGGTTFIRVTDNGCGIDKSEISTAFLRHSTSKIKSVEDLFTVSSLGFRGEALSSIASVSQVELITKTSDSLTGARYQIEGGTEKGLEEVGAPDGTTFIVRNLFFNTPVRRKFLKTATTEGAHVADLVEKIALSHPEVSIRFIQNNQNKLHTSGNHNLKDIIYTIFGREIAANLLPVDVQTEEISIGGFIGKPLISRGNRNYENYYINGRYIRSNIISKAIEEAYKPFMMQHKYPFTMIHFTMEPELLDVNVHPTKMELRFRDGAAVYEIVRNAVASALAHKELIPEVSLDKPKKTLMQDMAPKSEPRIEPFEVNRRNVLERSGVIERQAVPERRENITYEKPAPTFSRTAEPPAQWMKKPLNEEQIREMETWERQIKKTELSHPKKTDDVEATETKPAYQTASPGMADSTSGFALEAAPSDETQIDGIAETQKETAAQQELKPEQLDLFGGKLLEPKARSKHKLIGQLFDTYWMVEYNEQLFIIDQHAAHEKVLYEKMMAALKKREYTAQYVNPPIILTLSIQEELLLKKNMDAFTQIGFEIEHFGGKEYAVRAVPANLFSIAKKELLMEMIDELSEEAGASGAAILFDKVASMSCKAAVKGNNRLSAEEANALIDQLLDLENPYACPHGRPTIISMSKYEIEKKFKRIL